MVSPESAFLRLSEYIKRQLPTLNAPGIAIGLTHREQILHVSVFGLANTAAGFPITPETLFHQQVIHQYYPATTTRAGNA